MSTAGRAISGALRLAAMLACMAAAPVMAHGTGTGPNGGQLQHTEGRHLELVVQGKSVSVFLLDVFNKAINVKEATARVSIAYGRRTEELALSQAGPNVFRGEIPAPVGRDATIVVTLAVPGWKPLVARYGGASHAGH